MKAHLMYKDRDFDLQTGLPPHEAALVQDLELNTLLGAMAAGDKFLLDVARKTVLTSLAEPEAILYRQHVLADCLDRPATIRDLYAIAVEALQRDKGIWGVLHPRDPDGVVHTHAHEHTHSHEHSHHHVHAAGEESVHKHEHSIEELHAGVSPEHEMELHDHSHSIEELHGHATPARQVELHEHSHQA